MYFADGRWWQWHKDRPDYQAFSGQRCTIESTGMTAEDAGVHMLRNLGQDGLSTDPGGLRTGQHGGYQAINIAVLAGAARIVLLGYDGKAAQGKSHWFGDHPVRNAHSDFVMYRKTLNALAPLVAAAGVDVINASPDSAVECFRKLPLEQALAR